MVCRFFPEPGIAMFLEIVRERGGGRRGHGLILVEVVTRGRYWGCVSVWGISCLGGSWGDGGAGTPRGSGAIGAGCWSHLLPLMASPNTRRSLAPEQSIVQ